MRKNKFMRAASGLLVAVLLTTCVISGTFAKYVTSENGEDSARVAKFGVKIKANGTMFADDYNTDDTEVVGTISKSVITSGETGDAVVAPGTGGNLASATISGTPEVAVRVEYTPELTIDEKWKDANGTEYCPIVFTVGNETYGMTGMKDASGTEVKNPQTSINALKTAVENAIKAYSKNYAAKTDLSGITNDQVKVSWNWAFDNNNDKGDTHLGDEAADNKAATIKLSIITTVTQID